jgi:hypothetical protein
VKKEIKDELINNAGNAMKIQKHQQQAVQNQLASIGKSIDHLSDINQKNADDLDDLLLQAELLCLQQGMNTSLITEDDRNLGIELSSLTEEEKASIQFEQLKMLDTVDADEDVSWDDYLNNIQEYAEKHQIDLDRDPFEDLMTSAERAEISERIRNDYKMKKANCDKYDYLIATFCGVASGLIDCFFVGMPGESKLGKWTDAQTDSLVEKFSKMVWNADKNNGITRRREPDGIASAIGFLEERFEVNYDARYAADLELGDQVLNMSSKDHHLKSLAHSPDLIGLFFSILDQFTGKASFVSDGQLIRLRPVGKGARFELEGGNFLAKLFCGFCNWIGHIMSDIAGSSGTRGHNDGRRGAGVPIPFFELFQFCDFGSFQVGDERKNLAELMSHVFQSGYDARFGAAMAIPVVINELLIRLLWAIKSRYYHKRTWKESIPIGLGSRPELRRMLVVGHGSLCLVDGLDAAARSGGQLLTFALHLNMIAWSRFAFSALIEIRALYKENSLDIVAMEKDLAMEWERLYGDTKLR